MEKLKFTGFANRCSGKMDEISDRVQLELKSWPKVTVDEHKKFGGPKFRVNGRENGVYAR